MIDRSMLRTAALIAVLGGAPAAALQAQAVAQSEAAARPRIALVLGGGGARGAAHVGVLQVLDELRIPIDCVAGTSMGALVGATFASGMAPGEIERTLVDIDWTQTIGGRGRRAGQPINRKLSGQNYSNQLEFGFRDGRLMSPGGLIGTQSIESAIRTIVADARFTQNFDELPIPFRAVATDMIAGDLVVFDSGDLAVAMRASMALPGVFAPVIQDGQVLVDGALMRNLPVDIARDLCGEVVIAVWMSTQAPDVDSVSSALALLGRSLDVMIRANLNAQVRTLGADDVGIELPVGDIGAGEFLRIGEAIIRGREAAGTHREALSRFSVSEAAYRAWRERVSRTNVATHTLAEVEIVESERVNPAYVRANLRAAEAGAEMSAEAIAAEAARVYALGDFERVDYRLSGTTDERVLEIVPIEKSWGPNLLRFDFGASTDGDADVRAILRADHNRTWVNARGGNWHNAVQIGQQTIFATDFYQPLDVRQRYFVHPALVFENSLIDLFLDGDSVAKYFVRQLYGQVDVGVNLGSRARLRAGLRRGWHLFKRDTGLPGLPEQAREAESSVQMRATYDTRDAIGFTTRGTYASLHYAHSAGWLGGEGDYGLVEGVVSHTFSAGGHPMSVILGGGDTLHGDLPATQAIELGGIRTFPGLRPGELRGERYWYAGTSYQWQLLELQPLFGQALFAGLRLQAAEMSHRFDGVDDGVLYGISGSVGGRTPIGPFLVSLGLVDNGSWQFQFTLGRPVVEGSLLDAVH